MKRILKSLRDSFLVGFFAILPLTLSVWIFFWLANLVLGVTDRLLVFLPDELHQTHWRLMWRLFAMLIAVAFVSLLGSVTRNMIGQSLLRLVDAVASRVPLLKRIYGPAKQIVEAMTATRRGVFQRVVLFYFPHRQCYSLGFVTSEQQGEASAKTEEELLSIFLPTPPNPTTGLLLLVPRRDTIPLEMSVMDAMKMTFSGGAITGRTASPGSA